MRTDAHIGNECAGGVMNIDKLIPFFAPILGPALRGIQRKRQAQFDACT